MWRCPACHTHIRLDERDGQRPETGRLYRCPVCRLDLRLDARHDRMEIAPLEPDHTVVPSPNRRRSIPPTVPLPKPPPLRVKRPTIPKPTRTPSPPIPPRRLPPKPPKRKR